MYRRAPGFLTLRVMLAAAALLTAACGDASIDTSAPGSTTSSISSTTLAPDPWAEVETNFMAGCREANATVSELELLDVYCRCTYSEVVEFYGTLDAFREAEGQLDGDPAAFDPLLELAFDGCARLHLN